MSIEDELKLMERFPLVGCGMEGVVYRMTPDTVAKFPRYSAWKEVHPKEILYFNKAIKNDHDIAVLLYNNGIKVARPVGLFNMPLPWKVNKLSSGRKVVVPGKDVYQAYVMQYISGEYYAELYEDEYNLAEEQMNVQLEKAKKLGFSYTDGRCPSEPPQCIWSPENGGSVLIDFCRWRKVF